jgi:hypothetical protein
MRGFELPTPISRFPHPGFEVTVVLRMSFFEQLKFKTVRQIAFTRAAPSS